MAGTFVAAFLGVNLAAHQWALEAIVKHAGNLCAAGVVAVIAARMAETYARGEFFAQRQLAAATDRSRRPGG